MKEDVLEAICLVIMWTGIALLPFGIACCTADMIHTAKYKKAIREYQERWESVLDSSQTITYRTPEFEGLLELEDRCDSENDKVFHKLTFN
jgi:hypothetical protein